MSDFDENEEELRSSNGHSIQLSRSNSLNYPSRGDKHELFQSHKMREMESLDYRVADDDTLRIYHRTSNLSSKNVQKVVAKWFIYLMIGVIVGVLAWAIKVAIDQLQEFKYKSVEVHMKDNKIVAFLIYYGITALYAIIGCVVVMLCGPLSGGSGIPEVKGYLNGVRLEGTINIRSFFGKIISIIFSYSSCLALGPEGPMVHIGSMVGGGLSAGKSRTLHIRLPKVFEVLRTDKEQRDFISSGAAAGIAAAFGAPIGGVLFALEETSSFWSRELTWRTFFGTMVAAFTVNGMFKIGDVRKHIVDDYGLLTFGLSRYYLYRYEELFAFALLGVMGGLVGALFVKLNITLNKWRRDNLRKKKFAGLVEVIVLVTACAIITFAIPALAQCKSVEDISQESHANVCDAVDNDTLPMEWFCEEGYYNDFANLFLVPQDKALKNLFSRTIKMFSFPSLIVFLILYFAMVTVTAGILNASGLFVPMMLVGATMGRIYGKFLGSILFPHSNPPIDPSIYALVGSAAMMSGFSRTTISLVVIMMELTENTQFLLPIMLAVMLAKFTGDAFGHSIYESLMELKSITFLTHHPPYSTYSYTVHDVMANNVVCLKETESLARIVEVMDSTSHNAFPVVYDFGQDRQHTFRGTISRRQLTALLYTRRFKKKDAVHEKVMLVDHEQNVSLLNHRKLNFKASLPVREPLEDYVVDLSPYVDKSAPMVQNCSSYLDAYKMFSILGLRHLIVVDDMFQVVGILTRHDLLHFYYDTGRDSDRLDL